VHALGRCQLVEHASRNSGFRLGKQVRRTSLALNAKQRTMTLRASELAIAGRSLADQRVFMNMGTKYALRSASCWAYYMARHHEADSGRG
jgi:hypothetical protein